MKGKGESKGDESGQTANGQVEQVGAVAPPRPVTLVSMDGDKFVVDAAEISASQLIGVMVEGESCVVACFCLRFGRGVGSQ